MTWCETCLHLCLYVVYLTWSLNATQSLYNLFSTVHVIQADVRKNPTNRVWVCSAGGAQNLRSSSVWLMQSQDVRPLVSLWSFISVSSSPSSAAHTASLFSLWSDGYAVLIHAPAPSTLPASRRPTLGTNKETNNKDHPHKKKSTSPDGTLQTHLLLFKIATPVTVGNVDVMMGVKNLSTEAFGKCSQQFTARGLHEEAELCGVIHSQPVLHTFTEVHIKYYFTSVGLWVGVRSRIG